ncbi:NeuD/PglB/VioB family sugar acetyltransferase [Modicisalibacter coralii]|uniref:NeuD/PglB/VioB family sugar acetyltransferase n=1 Tax=Modicisalibacter coralii TaxID=2304602 RepID=UPI00100B92AB|nr:NeuD/PglB/VioB family sugar acetyltransferase [Halomonas coralii]
MADYYVLGGGGQARVLVHCLVALGHRARGYTAPQASQGMPGVAYLGTDRDILARDLPPGERLAVIGVGKVDAHADRLGLLFRYQARGFHFPALVSHAAIVHADVVCGDGSVVLDGAVVVTGARLGRACIVNTRAGVDHDCWLGDDVHIAPGATLSGGVHIGDHCLIGTGANLIHSVSVCSGVVVGAGATVVGDINEPGVYVGTPARRIA